MNRTLFANVSRVAAVVLTIAAVSVPARAQTASSGQSRELPSYLFQVALLIAEREGNSNVEDLPKNTRKAIEDIKDFLPFSSYRLIDVSVIRSNAHGRGLISGPNGEDYQVSFDFQATGEDERILVRSFTLKDLRVPQPAAPGQNGTQDTAPQVPAGSRNLVSSSFSVVPGETIVVGSSKLEGGGSALVVLLTAIP